jgi:mono/diheme cytochrome c family protein
MSLRVRIITGLVMLLLGLGVATLVSIQRRGFSTLDEPSAMERVMATTMRRYAVPSDLREAKNPVAITPEVLAEARAHFADHCAGCHGNDGKGQTSLGQRFYPRVPDLTKQETQSQSDGALFATIENGIRLTAMPAFGDGSAESAYGSWTLVHFIRHMPDITPAELEEMKKMNPISPAEMAEQNDEADFLNGDGTDDGALPAATHHH